MLLRLRVVLPSCIRHLRTLTTTAPLCRLQTSKYEPETSMGSAKHKPRIGSMSFGLLISELNNNNSIEGSKMPDDERTKLRKVGYWVLGVPVFVGVLGSVIILNERRQRGRKQWESEQGDDEG
ncbi:hypothetical protein EG328_002952 [Venturia inaequalis]|uniref:Uncharacterized protein n=1 Tax=Venturia inaequalis TaxID=5025 RepID=A0A8H3URK1_VENIN|nr:hypothetical protein EG328_002952 [Venturia inaequalis]